LLDSACAYARELLQANAPARPTSVHAAPGATLPDNFFVDYTARKSSQWKGQLAPHLAVEAVRIACEQPLEVGLTRELELFVEAMESPQSKALRHLFFAEREAAKVPGIDASLPLRQIRKVAVIGAGTMGGGIAMNFVNIGMPVVLPWGSEPERERAEQRHGGSVAGRRYSPSTKAQTASAKPSARTRAPC